MTTANRPAVLPTLAWPARLSHKARTGAPRGRLQPNRHGGAQLHKDKAVPSWSDWHVSLTNEVIFGSISLSLSLLLVPRPCPNVFTAKRQSESRDGGLGRVE